MKTSKGHTGTNGKVLLSKRNLVQAILGFMTFTLVFVLAALPRAMAQNEQISEEVSEQMAVELEKEDDVKTTEETSETVVTTKVTESPVEETTVTTTSVAATEYAATTEAIVTTIVRQEKPVVTTNPETGTVAEEAIEPEETYEETYDTYEETYEETEPEEYYWDGPVLTASAGRIQGPSGEETYYNLPMGGCIALMEDLGYNYEYSVREDGVKLYGGYIMVAANLDIRPKGTLVETSLGTGIVVDTGGFAAGNPYQLDIAVTW